MRCAVKLQGKQVRAWELGAGTEMEKTLIREGKIRKTECGYELFSREAVNGRGQRAKGGDFFKLDSEGHPYPNDREWFLANHRHLAGDTYEQTPKPLEIWQAEDGENEGIAWLREKGRLILRKDDPERYFNAHLWGADLSAAKDAVVVFYGVDRNDAGEITDISFNFVAWEEFQRTYTLCDSQGRRI